ncbi:MAG: acyl-CoA thioesterase II, partial [Pseudomonadota bacterium]
QALVAASRTVEGRDPHSLHSYFLRPGDPSKPVLYDVDRIRDGKSFTTRRVNAIQSGEAIFSMAVSFQVEERSFTHQFDMPDVPPPEDLPSDRERRMAIVDKIPQEYQENFVSERAIELRPIDDVDMFRPKKRPPHQSVWMRVRDALPDDLATQQCALAYASDMTLLDTSLLPHGVGWMDNRLQSVSLDHSMWFHRPFRADEWLLYVQDSPAAWGARGFTRGSIYTRDGRLVVSVTQEGLVRYWDEA